METSIAKTSSSKSVILASTFKFELLRKIFCQNYFDCCQVRSARENILSKILWLLPGPATQRDCLRRLPLWTVTRLLTGDLHACPSSGAPGTINQSRLRIVLFQPIRVHVYPLQKNSLLDPGKNIPYLKPQDIMNSEKPLSGNMWQENSLAVWRLPIISLQSATTTLSLSQFSQLKILNAVCHDSRS